MRNIDVVASVIFDKSAELALAFFFLSISEEYDKIKQDKICDNCCEQK
jgi:hypothetical protein